MTSATAIRRQIQRETAKPRRPVRMVGASWLVGESLYEVTVPIRILSKNQTSAGKENGFARARRRAHERTHVRNVLGRHRDAWRWPLLVTIYRVAPRLLDDDNPDVKSVRDEVAAWLGVNDGDTSKVQFVTSQKKAPGYGCCIRIEPKGPTC